MYQFTANFPPPQGILSEVFPPSDRSCLPSAALQLSLSLLDDAPAADPRWAEVVGGGGGGGVVGGTAPISLIITNQIKDKITAHRYFVAFLQQVGGL